MKSSALVLTRFYCLFKLNDVWMHTDALFNGPIDFNSLIGYKEMKRQTCHIESIEDFRKLPRWMIHKIFSFMRSIHLRQSLYTKR